MKTYQAGIDVGSTTVKLVVLDENGQMIFGQYQRHLSHTQRALSDLLKQARAALGERALEVSSTLLRTMIKRGENTEEYLSPEVRRIIEREKLYR